MLVPRNFLLKLNKATPEFLNHTKLPSRRRVFHRVLTSTPKYFLRFLIKPLLCFVFRFIFLGTINTVSPNFAHVRTPSPRKAKAFTYLAPELSITRMIVFEKIMVFVSLKVEPKTPYDLNVYKHRRKCPKCLQFSNKLLRRSKLN